RGAIPRAQKYLACQAAGCACSLWFPVNRGIMTKRNPVLIAFCGLAAFALAALFGPVRASTAVITPIDMGEVPAIPVPPITATTVIPPKGPFINVSSRGVAGAGDNVLIMGFVVKHATGRVLVRAVGPGLV